MAINTIKAGARYYKLTPAAQSLPGAPFLELGPAGTTSLVSTLMVQFNPTDLWSGSFVVVGRMLGTAAADRDTPFVPIPYRRISLADVAQDYAMVTAQITGAAIIQIPANGMTIALMFEALAGQMDITAWDLQGNSAP
jgi:hypothetical protein